MTIKTPDWVKHAVFYQIYPDRFARSPRTKHPRGITFKKWGSPPEEQGYQGGDLYGVVDKLDYLKDLGITALYLNPIFSSASNHGYHTFDYMQVNPLLGGNEALRELLDEAHARNMYVVLDGVFNHASRGFWPFHHVLENGEKSPYIDWFTIYDYPLRPYSSTRRKPANYACWWNLPALPTLNTDNLGVRDYIFDVARYWIEFGIDGWRLDVPEEIDDDSFWQEFRRVVKGANPETYICKTLRPHYHPEGLPLKKRGVKKFAKLIDHMHSLYDWEINHVQLNLLDSHDMARALWIMDGDKSALQLCALFQMTMPGAPCIYYGDEIGLSSDGDPHCRGAFPWENEDAWDKDLLTFYKKATVLRHDNPILRTGTFQQLYAKSDVYAFQRQLDEQQAIVVFNAATKSKKVTLPLPDIESKTFTEIWQEDNEQLYQVKGNKLEVTVPARDIFVLITSG